MEIHCPIHEEKHEVYQGYRECPFVYEKVKYLSQRDDKDPIHIISTGKFLEDIDERKIGLGV